MFALAQLLVRSPIRAFRRNDPMYHRSMTKLLEQAVETARSLAPEKQDEIARLVLLAAADDQAATGLTAEEEASFAESRAQAARGEFATDEQVSALWSKYGL
ncbi:hypothetical protein [Methylopila turkensis]|uniref:hypothetical protein n=1 Tax=Methylopila turkensis TaxID=1437816 RepID=UPI003D178D01